MNILLFGKTGQVGWELQRALAPLGNLIALDVHSKEYCGDFSKPEGIAETVRAIKPDVIVNAAAHTAVDKAESEPEFAQLLNATSVEAIAKEAAKIGAWVVHYSTDYVFPGDGDKPWRETDATAPLNVYGQTKLDGEKAVTDSGCDYLIIRTSWLYSSFGNNFVKTIRRLTAEKDSLKVVFDQVGTPTYAGDLAQAILKIIDSGKYADNAGIYHFSNEGVCSWYDFAIEIRNLSGNLCDIQPCHSAEFPSKVKRPNFSVLDKTKIKETFGLKIPYWKVSLREMT